MIIWRFIPSMNWFVLRESDRRYLTLGVGLAGLFFLRKIYVDRQRSYRKRKWATIKSSVILHRKPHSISQESSTSALFSLKVETYLRIAGIQYEIDYEEPVSQSGHTPWISLNGVEIKEEVDISLTFHQLAETFGINLSSHLSSEEKVKARAIQISAEEHLQCIWHLWYSMYSRRKIVSYVHQKVIPLLYETIPFMRKIENENYPQRLVQLPEKIFIEAGIRELRFFSRLLGSKTYFMGEKPTELDCSMFAILSHILWNMVDTPFEWQLKSEFLNLAQYCERIKYRLWLY